MMSFSLMLFIIEDTEIRQCQHCRLCFCEKEWSSGYSPCFEGRVGEVYSGLSEKEISVEEGEGGFFLEDVVDTLVLRFEVWLLVDGIETIRVPIPR